MIKHAQSIATAKPTLPQRWPDISGNHPILHAIGSYYLFFLGRLGTFPSPLLSDEVGPYGGSHKDFLYEVGNVFLRL